MAFDEFLFLVRKRNWHDACFLGGEMGIAEKQRRIAARLCKEWASSFKIDSRVTCMHVVGGTSEHTHIIFCHSLASPNITSTLDQIVSESAGRRHDTDILVLYWKGNDRQKKSIKTHIDDEVVLSSLLIHDSMTFRLSWVSGKEQIEHKRISPRDEEEYSRYIMEWFRRKPGTTTREQVHALVHQLPSFMACGADNVAIGARPGDILHTKLTTGEEALKFVVPGNRCG